MENIRYSKEHVWARLDDDDRVTIGISEFAAHDWGEASLVSLPEEGAELVKDEVFGTLEAVSVEDLFAPLSGEVSEVNAELEESPEIINEDPLHDGWLIRILVTSLADFDELLTEEEYEEYLKDEFDVEPGEVEDIDDVEELDELEDLEDVESLDDVEDLEED
jgi:glycine cleavage system H protein